MRYSFVVSGAADMSFCTPNAEAKAYELGKAIVENDGILITGATTGIPFSSARGAKDGGGISIGISPAATYASHVKTYHLPTDNFDFIIYSGFEYSGRNLILTKSADAVIVGCGGFGTLNEFTIALEDGKPIGVLTSTGGTADEIKNLLNNIKDPHKHGGGGNIIFSDDPRELVVKLVAMIESRRKTVVVNPPIGE